MQLRMFRLRFRRRLRKSQRQVEGLGQEAEANLERYFFRRFISLRRDWRFVSTWVGLLLLLVGVQVNQIASLSGHYQTLRPVTGGVYS